MLIISIIIFLIILSLLIFVHEAGHFFVARKLGVWAEEFGFGLPPRVWGKKVGETIYSLNLLPIGGFVRLHGENTEDTITNPKRAFLNKSKKVRAAIITAGVVMNLLLAIVAFGAVYSVTGIPGDRGVVQVLAVSKDSPAEAAGLQVNDYINMLDNMEVDSESAFISAVDASRGREIVMNITRGGQEMDIKVTPRADPPEGQGALGVAFSNYYFAPVWQRPFLGVYYGFGEAIFWGKNILLGLQGLAADVVSLKVPEDLAGPVGIFSVTQEVAKLGVLPLINLLGILSVNLAIVNILPIPALDGGRLLFIIIEAITGKRVSETTEAKIHTAGMFFLLAMLFIVTVIDFRRLAAAGQLPGIIAQFFK